MSKAALQSLGKEGRKNVIENYTKDKMCLKTLEILPIISLINSSMRSAQLICQ